jgi:mRNA interferase RelE/StbE
MKTRISPRAEKEFRKLNKVAQMLVAKKIRGLGAGSVDEERLKGVKNIYRVRVGDYRMVYKRTRKEIFVVLVGHRRDIYRKVRQMFS